MSFQVPNMPAPFLSCKSKITPNPRTTRGGDLTWFNTSGSTIIKSDYNTCTFQESNHLYPWGYVTEPVNRPFDLQGNNCNLFHRFGYRRPHPCYINPN